VTLGQPTFGHGGNARTDEKVHMRSFTTRAALDAWLAHTEKLLRDQQDGDSRDDEDAEIEDGDAA